MRNAVHVDTYGKVSSVLPDSFDMHCGRGQESSIDLHRLNSRVELIIRLSRGEVSGFGPDSVRATSFTPLGVGSLLNRSGAC